jgi:hypothetical protein
MNPQFEGIDMKIDTLPASFLLVLLLVFSVSQPVRADVMQLIPLLTKNLGVTEPQAKGGAAQNQRFITTGWRSFPGVWW